MKVSEFQTFGRRALQHRKPFLVKGPPGVGKTYSFQQMCSQLDMDLIVLCAPLQSPVKVGGYPRPSQDPNGDATHQLFNGIAKAYRATKPTVLLWDDLAMATGETLKSILDTVQFGTIDGKQLPDCVTQCGATNDVGHGAEIMGLIEPMKTRWHTIVSLEPCVDETVQFGLSRGWPADLLAYIRNNPTSINDWKPTKSISVDGSTGRGLEHVAGWINIGEDNKEVIAGCIGAGHATAYLAFRELQSELPDINAILMSPDSAPVPENPSARLMVCYALAGRMTAGNFGVCVQYLSRLPQMFRAFAVRDAFKAEAMRRENKQLPKDYRPLSSSRDFTAWACSKDGQDIMSAAGGK